MISQILFSMNDDEVHFPILFSKHVTFVEFKIKHRRTFNSEDDVSCEMLTYFYSFIVHDKVVNKEKRFFVE